MELILDKPEICNNCELVCGKCTDATCPEYVHLESSKKEITLDPSKTYIIHEGHVVEVPDILIGHHPESLAEINSIFTLPEVK